MGEVSEQQMIKVEEILRAVVSRNQSFNYWLGEIGVFPDPQSPRVLMIKVTENRMQSVLVHDEIRRELIKLGIELDNRSWIPHITLGRITNGEGVPAIFKKIDYKTTSWLVDRMELIKSELTPAGPQYVLLEEYKFNDISKSFILLKNYLNKKVEVVIDRPLGSVHPKYKFTYESNYGYIPDTMAPDGEEVDAYFLGVDKAVTKGEGKCIAIIHRFGDDDDKLVVVPEDVNLTDEEIIKTTYFQEKWFKNRIYRG